MGIRNVFSKLRGLWEGAGEVVSESANHMRTVRGVGPEAAFVFGDGSAANIAPKMEGRYPAIWKAPKESAPIGKGTLAAGMNAVGSMWDAASASPFMGALKGASPALAGAALGGGIGFVGNIAFPNNFGVDSPGKSALFGAAAGIGLRGLGTHGIPQFTKSMEKLGLSTGIMTEPIGAVQKVASSKVTLGAISAAAFYGSINTNLTRPINGQSRV